jgi:hypothetical protein
MVTRLTQAHLRNTRRTNHGTCKVNTVFNHLRDSDMSDTLTVANITEQMLRFQNKINDIVSEVRHNTACHKRHSVWTSEVGRCRTSNTALDRRRPSSDSHKKAPVT